jgi:lipopolysaccharide biosynthesis protein
MTASSKPVFFHGEVLPKSEINFFFNRKRKKVIKERFVGYFWFIARFD